MGMTQFNGSNFSFHTCNLSSLLSVTYTDMRWVCHGNILSFGDRAGIPLHLTSQCTQYDSTRIPFVVTPKALRLRTKEHMKGNCKK